ncbi:MAG: Pyruvate kinase [candidate division CPR2 bacterium GW2011_GWC1_39_9]|uniref:Pyruvate kinase n=1 Tax=candidate division CPR2 bacterium GW2011_GWC2_39_10 TaxID=1618345 RepID=A0A0G0LQD6_UNCC2|nr:MAG: Pyruvate kinase [candidate division CPR2 bacterium GW2011_GWC2_39_10]KKR34079.1 MAG: Pyruvate kinase [candidate division CPR2 bacterium GW2011_GWC1_39_9]
MIKMTKIIATLGPASESYETICELIKSGVNIFRLNFSHDSYENHQKRVENIRKAADNFNKNIAILQDLQGPKIRVGEIDENGIKLENGTEVILTVNAECDGKIEVQYKDLDKDVSVGDIVLLDDGLLELKVLGVENGDIRCQVIVGGILKSKKGINLPTSSISIPAISEKDENDAKFGCENGVDFIALSFVKNGQDIKDLRKIIGENGPKIIAKIERHEAVQNVREIVEEADGIMVARGDLGVELGMDKVPVLQKRIINECLRQNKPVIVATQMLESMTKNPRPTRAEASDVANAILDGADAVMLSAETAVGDYPLEAVKTICNIATDVEAWVIENQVVIGKRNQNEVDSVAEAISNTVVRLAKQTGAKLILVPTATGITANLISNRRPFVPVLAITHGHKAMRRMAILWGVQARVVGFNTVEEMIVNGIEIAKKYGYIKIDDRVIIASGKLPGVPGGTNIVEVMTVE